MDDPGTNDSVVVTLDTAVGTIVDLRRTSVAITSPQLAASGDEWLWIQPDGSGTDNELWRQALQTGTARKLANLDRDDYLIQLSADASQVVITKNRPNGNSDCPSAEYRVWDRASETFTALPTNVEERVVAVIGGSAFIVGWCSDHGLDEVNLVTKQRVKVAGEDTGTPVVYGLEDGSPVLVYTSPTNWPQQGLFEYHPERGEPQLIYETGHDVDDFGSAPILVAPDDFGGINIKGWAPMFPNGTPFLLEPDAAAVADVPRLLVSLKDGTVALAPPIRAAVDLRERAYTPIDAVHLASDRRHLRIEFGAAAELVEGDRCTADYSADTAVVEGVLQVGVYVARTGTIPYPPGYISLGCDAGPAYNRVIELALEEPFNGTMWSDLYRPVPLRELGQ